jgi:hypothetical protein
MPSHSRSLELDFSKLLGFDQLPRALTGNTESGQASLLPSGLQSKVGGKPVIGSIDTRIQDCSILCSRIGVKVGMKP